MEPFRATHRISDHYRRIPVHVVDGACYTRKEWDTCTAADWEVSPVSRLTFMGVHIPHAKIRPIKAREI